MASHKGGLVYKYVATSTPETDDTDCKPPNSRIMVVSKEPMTETDVYGAFAEFGIIEYIKILSAKPMAFVKYAKTSFAELAQEAGPHLQICGSTPKVYVAETRNEQGKSKLTSQSTDPDDQPPRSRLFVVLLHKDVQVEQIEATLRPFPGLTNVRKVPNKPIAFAKYQLASQAAVAMETVMDHPPEEIKAITVAEAKAAGFAGSGFGAPVRAPYHEPAPAYAERRYSGGYDAYPLSGGGKGGKGDGYPPSGGGKGGKGEGAPNNRLFLVTGKSIYSEDLSPVVGQLPGFDYLDLKLTPGGIPKGFAYATFMSIGAASAALRRLNDMEVKGLRLKAVYAEDRGAPGGAPPPAPRDVREMYDVRDVSRMPPPRRPMPSFAPSRGMPSFGGGEVELNGDVPRRPPDGVDPDYPASSRLFYVLSAGCAITEDNLISLFRRYPGLQYVQPQGGSKTFGYAKYDNPGSADSAIRDLDHKQLGDSRLKVVLANPTSERGPRKRQRD